MPRVPSKLRKFPRSSKSDRPALDGLRTRPYHGPHEVHPAFGGLHLENLDGSGRSSGVVSKQTAPSWTNISLDEARDAQAAVEILRVQPLTNGAPPVIRGHTCRMESGTQQRGFLIWG